MNKKLKYGGLFGTLCAFMLLNGCTTSTETPTNKIETISIASTDKTTEQTTETAAQAPAKKLMTAEEMCESVLNAIQAEDTEGLKNLFCDEIKNTHDLDKELAEFYNSVDGKFVFFTDYHSELNYGGERKKGVYVKYHICSSIRVARTDTGKEYYIEFYANLVYDKKPNNIGVEYIIIRDNDDNEIKVGEYIDGN